MQKAFLSIYHPNYRATDGDLHPRAYELFYSGTDMRLTSMDHAVSPKMHKLRSTTRDMEYVEVITLDNVLNEAIKISLTDPTTALERTLDKAQLTENGTQMPTCHIVNFPLKDGRRAAFLLTQEEFSFMFEPGTDLATNPSAEASVRDYGLRRRATTVEQMPSHPDTVVRNIYSILNSAYGHLNDPRGKKVEIDLKPANRPRTVPGQNNAGTDEWILDT